MFGKKVVIVKSTNCGMLIATKIVIQFQPTALIKVAN